MALADVHYFGCSHFSGTHWTHGVIRKVRSGDAKVNAVDDFIS